MKKQSRYLQGIAVLLSAGFFFLYFTGCSNMGGEQQPMSHDQQVVRGKYLVQASGCNDCHSPKIMTAQGPMDDTTRLLSGHPADMPLFPVDTAVLHGAWIQAAPDLTAWAGPWGVSYSANLTPDEKTGLGGWTEDIFIRTIRTGKYHGVNEGRTLLPPMPWQNFRGMTDEDLKAIFAYLQSVPAVNNAVPAPVPPNQIPMAKK